jgi:hypothetical protein
MVEVRIEEMGRTEADRKITSGPWSSMRRGQRRTRKTTLRSQWRSVLKKDLTEPTLLEMSGKATWPAPARLEELW